MRIRPDITLVLVTKLLVPFSQNMFLLAFVSSQNNFMVFIAFSIQNSKLSSNKHHVL